MSVDQETVRRIARLARIGLAEDQIEPMMRELNTILDWIEQLAELETAEVPPMTSAVATALKRRADRVTDGGYAEDIVKNAPARVDGFFAVPKVVE